MENVTAQKYGDIENMVEQKIRWHKKYDSIENVIA